MKDHIDQHSKEILSELDRFGWKHSMYLPRRYGGIDWWNHKTAIECKAIIEEHLKYAKEMQDRCERLLEVIDWDSCCKNPDTEGSERR